VRLRAGERAELDDGSWFGIVAVEEHDRLLTYRGERACADESRLSPTMQVHTPLQLLLGAAPDSNDAFALRRQALATKCDIATSAVRGFVGPRIDLLPHQMSVAGRVSGRFIRRALLSDEVGLGKTIEAGLILHNCLVRGLVRRALICVPESLVHIWFVELLRKFAITARIIDADTIGPEEIEQGSDNPFLRDAVILADIGFLSSRPPLARLALEAEWDMAIFDEAHQARQGSAAFEFMRDAGERIRDLLMLTGTPQQNGVEGHFARLRILDPIRYPSLEEYRREMDSHQRIASCIEPVVLGQSRLSDETFATLRSAAPDREALFADLRSALARGAMSQEDCIAALLDRLGVGRALFRNTRAAVGGFPDRTVTLYKLDAAPPVRAAAAAAFAAGDAPADDGFAPEDPRPRFVAKLLRDYPDDKFLIICRTREKVETFRSLLAKHISLDCATFHEGLSLVQRDRNAAWFAREDGARALLCSEIGSEGRNFQFVHHLIMLDLPLSPELVEQRIGRLDRIGQTQTICIHAPYLAGTPHEALVRWHAEGLGTLERNVSGAGEVHERLRDRLVAILRSCAADEPGWRERLDEALSDARRIGGEVAARLEEGRDRLLELQSFDRPMAASLIDSIQQRDRDGSIERLVIRLLKEQSVIVEAVSEGVWKLWGAGVDQDLFRGISSSRPLATFDRGAALAREDIEFITQDHPSLHGAIDLYLGSTRGTHAYAVWRTGAPRELILDALFVLECIAAPELAADRFLPPTPIRIAVDHHGKPWGDNPDESIDDAALEDVGSLSILAKPEARERVIPSMEKAAAALARKRAAQIIEQARRTMQAALTGEIHRMRELAAWQRSNAEAEIARAEKQRERLARAIDGARPRPDALRLIWRTGEADQSVR
jgi:ATP-dependent helicase HepA